MGWHPGGLGWALARNQLAEEIVLFDDEGGLAGWAGVGREPGELLAQVDSTHPEVAHAIVEWLLRAASARELTIEVANGDRVLVAALEQAGFTYQPVAEGGLGMRHACLPGAPRCPPGYTVRAVRADETLARVEVHRAAWAPASLPWHPDHRPVVDPRATSSFTMKSYEAARETWLYDANFDLVAVAPDGTLAGCCIAWFDPASRCAEIEPLGVVPEHRRNGLAGAMCLEVVARVAAGGGEEVFIDTGPNAAYPASSGAYAKAGFEVVRRSRAYSLRRSAP
jgi:ribosomal protein S18 acetylase RimI-like enzyme